MNLLLFLFNEIAFYWLWWVCFIAIGFCFGRYLGLLGVLVAPILISSLILGIEFHSVFQDMNDRPELGRDADLVFMFGVLVRIGLFNCFVLPFSIVGRRLRARHRRVTNDHKVA